MAMAEDFNNLFNPKPYDPGFQYEDRWYMADPKTDVLLFDGSHLKDGMLVMIGEPTMRARTPIDPQQCGKASLTSWLYQAKVYNRWCYVSDLRIDEDLEDNRKRRVVFIGTYEDGVQVKHGHDLDNAWIVKKSSMPGFVSEEEARQAWEKLQTDFPVEFAKVREFDEMVTRDERVRKYHALAASERATYAVIHDYRGDILALEPHAVVGIDQIDGRPMIVKGETLREMGWDRVAEIVEGPDCQLRQQVKGLFRHGMVPSEVAERVEHTRPLLDTEHPIDGPHVPKGTWLQDDDIPAELPIVPGSVVVTDREFRDMVKNEKADPKFALMDDEEIDLYNEERIRIARDGDFADLPFGPDWTPPQFDNKEWPAQHGSDESESKDH